MLAAFSVWPSGGNAWDSGHDAVAAAVKIVRASGLPNHTGSMFTTLEGEWDEVFDVIRRAADAALAYGKRVDLVIKADIRPGHQGELAGKVEAPGEGDRRTGQSGGLHVTPVGQTASNLTQ